MNKLELNNQLESVIEALIFDPAIMKVAFLLQHKEIKTWVLEKMEEVRFLNKEMKLKEKLMSIKDEQDHWLDEAKDILKYDQLSIKWACEREKDIFDKFNKQKEIGTELWFDRRLNQWVLPSEWKPVPFIDNATTPKFHTACISDQWN